MRSPPAQSANDLRESSNWFELESNSTLSPKQVHFVKYLIAYANVQKMLKVPRTLETLELKEDREII